MKSLFLTALWAIFFFALTDSAFGFQAGTDLGKLVDLVGVDNANGSGVDLLQVEGSRVIRDVDDVDNDGDTSEIISRFYGPNTANGQFAGKSFQDLGDPSSDGSNTHASGVGVDLYGNSFGTAGGIGDSGSPPISFTSASSFINNDLINGGSTPVVFTHDVSNHSYIFEVDDESANVEDPFTENDAVEILRRLDYSINEGNMTTVVGTNRGDSSTPLPALFVHAYNTINVGRSNGMHASGLTTFNGAGRNGIHLVTDETTTSGATAVVSGLASILHQSGRGTDATKQEVVKATLLAGASKEEFSGNWSNSSTQPLDLVFGAGQANIFNSFLIQQAGEVDGVSADVNSPTTDFNGWDYDLGLAPGDERFYDFLVESNSALDNLSIALTWNIDVNDETLTSAFFNPSVALADLSLELFDASGELVAISDSAVDNIEHLYFETLEEGGYRLRVANNSSADLSTDFGLAFRSSVVSTIPEPCSSALLAGLCVLCMVQRRKSVL